MSSPRYELNEPSVVAETVDGEVMVMNLREGVYYSIAGDGAAVWPALAAGASLASVAADFARLHAVPEMRVTQDLDAFVARLVDEAILRPHTAGSADAGVTGDVVAIAPGGAPYVGFALERFDDMRAMLVIDPVHEVGEFGWPQRIPDNNT